MGAQWGHGYHKGKADARKEVAIVLGAVAVVDFVGKKGYRYIEEKYPEKISTLKEKSSNIFKRKK